ncbi:hypothetical protein ACFU76_07730 [Streptomyces sp. NPDC057539]|uniref:hypothetical protein n=1 Tax=Streptomyces sp. NPDC057539 TaxID=3346159 RepID=UPI00368D82EF
MSEWGIALIAAGSALVGSLITGWFTRTAGGRQAEAARHAGDRQADAVLDTVRATLEEQRAVRVLDLRRQTYVRFLESAEVVSLSWRTGHDQPGDRPALQRAFVAVLLEGPEDVSRAARRLVDCLRDASSPDDLDHARSEFIDAARGTLSPPGGGQLPSAPTTTTRPSAPAPGAS